jgi:hypothetical protein
MDTSAHSLDRSICWFGTEYSIKSGGSALKSKLAIRISVIDSFMMRVNTAKPAFE